MFHQNNFKHYKIRQAKQNNIYVKYVFYLIYQMTEIPTNIGTDQSRKSHLNKITQITNH